MRGKHSDPYVHCTNKKPSPSPAETLANLLILAAILWVLFKVFEVIIKEVVIPFFTFLADEIIIPFIRWADRGITRGCDAIDKKLGWGVYEPVQRPVVGKFEGAGIVRLTDSHKTEMYFNDRRFEGPTDDQNKSYSEWMRLTR